MAMLDIVKSALRITSNAFNSELSMLITACEADLEISGLNTIDDTDELTQLAVVKYAKAEMNYQGDAERWRNAYKEQKISMGLCSSYNEVS